jgi:LysM repeat protein
MAAALTHVPLSYAPLSYAPPQDYTAQHDDAPQGSQRHLRLVPAPAARVTGVVPSAAVMRRRQLIAVAVLAAFAWLGVQVVATAADMLSVPAVVLDTDGAPVVHIVQPGESVWSIARAYQPSGDVRALVDVLVASNGGSTLLPGQALTIAP